MFRLSNVLSRKPFHVFNLRTPAWRTDERVLHWFWVTKPQQLCLSPSGLCWIATKLSTSLQGFGSQVRSERTTHPRVAKAPSSCQVSWVSWFLSYSNFYEYFSRGLPKKTALHSAVAISILLVPWKNPLPLAHMDDTVAEYGFFLGV